MKINITRFFQVQQAIKVFHWTTDDYSLHVLLDDFLKDYNEIMDDIVENVLSAGDTELELTEVPVLEGAFTHLHVLMQLVEQSFFEINENIDIMPKGMRTIMDEAKQFVDKYTYLFMKSNYGE
jgi:DNA-binding ferritin-like protein